MYELTPLGVDACLSDTSAACRYWHTKVRVLRGAIVIESELRFVGFAEEPRSHNGGWLNAATNLEALYRDRDRDEISNEDTQMLVALMSIENVELPPAHTLEFLG